MGGFNPPQAALAEDRRGERCGKGARDASGGDREDGAQSSVSGIAAAVSLLNKVASKPGCSRSAREKHGGRTAHWPGGVRHVGDVSPVCCSCTERGKADLVRVLRRMGEREPAKRLNREAVKTGASHSIGRFHEEEGRLAIGILTHFARVGSVVASDAEHPTAGKALGAGAPEAKPAPAAGSRSQSSCVLGTNCVRS